MKALSSLGVHGPCEEPYSHPILQKLDIQSQYSRSKIIQIILGVHVLTTSIHFLKGCPINGDFYTSECKTKTLVNGVVSDFVS